MERERYDIERSEDDFVYWFYSEGPKGRIEKVIRFQRTSELGRNAFNLSFGDWDESAGRLNDRSIIWGKLGKEWEPFRKGVNYREFLLFKKIS